MDYTYNESNELNTIKVSNEFIDIYKNFNIYDQVEKMKLLTKKELYLLLALCLDNHSDEDVICLHNYKPYTDELNELYKVQDDKETTDEDIKALIEETSDKYIDVDILRDKDGNKLPDPMKKEEARDFKIGDILDNQK